MQLNSLSIAHLRNLHLVDLDLNPHFNIFSGDNGTGKTSLLEAVHVLTTGRSFRAHQARQIITLGEKLCRVSGIVSSREGKTPRELIRLGVERHQGGSIKIRMAEEDCHSIAALAKTLPIQLINSNSYAILEAAPQFRRQFLDWVMFHVEHSFYATWQRFKRALLQRNAVLRHSKSSPMDISIWDAEFIEAGEAIHLQRQAVLKELIPVFSEIISGLLNLEAEISLEYYPGWTTPLTLSEALDRSLERDRLWKYTTVGPQRADLELFIGDNAAKSVLSRGQSKLFICGLLIARALLLYRREARQCVFLIDDLNAELDKGSSKVLIEALGRVGSQVLITSIENTPLKTLLKEQEYHEFQVIRGQITPTS